MIHTMKGSTNTGGKGRSRKIIGKTIKKDLEASGLAIKMIYDLTL